MICTKIKITNQKRLNAIVFYSVDVSKTFFQKMILFEKLYIIVKTPECSVFNFIRILSNALKVLRVLFYSFKDKFKLLSTTVFSR